MPLSATGSEILEPRSYFHSLRRSPVRRGTFHLIRETSSGHVISRIFKVAGARHPTQTNAELSEFFIQKLQNFLTETEFDL